MENYTETINIQFVRNSRLQHRISSSNFLPRFTVTQSNLIGNIHLVLNGSISSIILKNFIQITNHWIAIVYVVQVFDISSRIKAIVGSNKPPTAFRFRWRKWRRRAPCFKEIQIVSDTKVAGAETGEDEEGRRLSSKLENRHGPKPELETNEEADAADSRSQSDKCTRIENRDFVSHQIYRGLWRFSCPIAWSGPHLLLAPSPPISFFHYDRQATSHPSAMFPYKMRRKATGNESNVPDISIISYKPPCPPASCRSRVVIADTRARVLHDNQRQRTQSRCI